MLSNTATPIEFAKFRSQVERGEIPVNEEISLQMNRINDLIADPRYYYDDEPLQGYIKFCENELVLSDGSPMFLLPSFRLWAEDLLCWFHFVEEKYYDTTTKKWKYRRVKHRLRKNQFLIVGRGASKTMYGSSIQAYQLCGPVTQEQLATSPTGDQSHETLNPIVTAMIKSRGPLLRSLTSGSKLSTRNDASSQKLVATNKGISNKLTNSNLVIRPMSVDKLQGYRFHTSTVDEWLSGDTRDDPILAIQQGAAKTGDYLLIATSSEGTVRDGIGDTIKMELKKKLRGEIYDPSTSIWYYKLDSIREIADPEMWLKANPNLGATVTYETYEKEVQVAEERPDKRSEVLAKRFGIPAEGFSYFFNYEETLPHPPQDFDGLECAMGCDLSQGDDFCAFTFLFPLGNSRFGVKTRAYVSSNKVAKLPEATKEKYKEFYGELSLIEMPKGVLDMEAVYDDLTTYIAEHQYNVISVGYDPYNSKYFIERWKMEYSAFYVDKVIQGARTESVPLGELKNLAEYRLLYFDQELMKFSMGNAITIEDNNGNRKLSKRRAIEKIDCVAALLDAWVSYTSHREVYSG